MISINSTFKYVDVTDGERIRIIEIQEDNVYVVNIDAATSMPRKEALDKLNEELETEKLINIQDPFLRIIVDKELSEIERIKRDEDWIFIEKYWKSNKDDILDKLKRNVVFNEISKESNTSLIKIKRLFSRFWQRGMNKNSLIPDYGKSRGRGKDKNLSKKGWKTQES